MEERSGKKNSSSLSKSSVSSSGQTLSLVNQTPLSYPEIYFKHVFRTRPSPGLMYAAWIPATLLLIGTTGWLIGSIMYMSSDYYIRAWSLGIFAVASIFTAAASCLSFMRVLASTESQSIGSGNLQMKFLLIAHSIFTLSSIGFGVFSIVDVYMEYHMIAVWSYIVCSCMYLIGDIIILAEFLEAIYHYFLYSESPQLSYKGSPFLSALIALVAVPAPILNFSGSVGFTVGSFMLLYPIDGPVYYWGCIIYIVACGGFMLGAMVEIYLCVIPKGKPKTKVSLN